MQRPRSIAHSRISQRSNNRYSNTNSNSNSRNHNMSSSSTSSSSTTTKDNNHRAMSIPPPTSESNWIVQDDALRDIPSFYPLEKSSRCVHDTPSRIAHRISYCCRLLSVQAHFNHDLATADLITEEHVEIHISLWKSPPPPAEATTSSSSTSSTSTDPNTIIATEATSNTSNTFTTDARPDCKRASWDRRKDTSLSKINRMYCRFKVLELMKANGSEDTSTLSHLSVDKILNRFDVGTEKPKSFGYPEPKDEELIPLRLMDITSDNQKAKNKLYPLQFEEGRNSGNDSDRSEIEVDVEKPPCQQAVALISGVAFDSDSSDSDLDEIIGGGSEKDEEDNEKDEEDNVGQDDETTSQRMSSRNNELDHANISPVDENSNLPPGWTAAFSQSRKRAYYTHPEYGATWYFPGFSGWKKMYCDKKNTFYYIHPDHGVNWVCPAAFYSSSNSILNNDNVGGRDTTSTTDDVSSGNDETFDVVSSLLRLHGGGEDGDSNLTILKKYGNGSLCAIQCGFCYSMPTTHVCRKEISNGSCMIEGESKKICGKAICVVCSEANGIDEAERRIRCPLHSISTKENTSETNNRNKNEVIGYALEKKSENGDRPTVAEEPSANKKNEPNPIPHVVTCSLFEPDYIKVVNCVAPLDSIMACGPKDYTDEKRRNIIGLHLLRFRKFEQEKKTFLNEKKSWRNNQQENKQNHHAMWNKAFEKCHLRSEKKYIRRKGMKEKCEDNDHPSLLTDTVIQRSTNENDLNAPSPSVTTPSNQLDHTFITNSTIRIDENINPNTTPPPAAKRKSINQNSYCSLSNPSTINQNVQPISTNIIQTIPANIPTMQRPVRSLPLSQTHSTHQTTKRTRKRKCNQTCKFHGCQNHNGMKNLKFTHVPKPPLPKQVPKPTDRIEKFERYYSKLTQHKEFLQNIGLPSTSFDYNNTRICSCHKRIEREKTMNVIRQVNGKNISQKINFKYEVPDSSGVKSTLSKNRQELRRKNTAKERRFLNEWDESRKSLNKEIGEKHAEDYTQLAMSFQQMLEDNTPSKKHSRNDGSYDPFLSPLGIKLKSPVKQRGFKRNRIRDDRKIQRRKKRSLGEGLNPFIQPKQLSKREIKRRTGFKCETSILKYIMIVCNGSFDLMTSTQSSLTWFEEWMLFFEMMWGKTHTRLEDLVGAYRLDKNNTFYHIIEHKLDLVLDCRKSWPEFASFEEDKLLRKEKWEAKYPDMRVVMWDDTNIPFTFKPSSAHLQKITYSSYYSMNCAKGGVFLQLCGWMGVEELWVGATSDSYYMEKSGILERQQKFAEKDLVNGEIKPFCLVMDKGYRIIRHAWRAGKQTCLQPKFAKSDAQFTTDELNFSGSVAADRSGNERAVRRAKLSSTLRRGLKPNGNPARLNKIWEAWSFQTNFMFGSVL